MCGPLQRATSGPPMDNVNFRVKLEALRTATREVERFVWFDSMLSQNLLVDGKMSTAAMFEAAYGDPRGRKYWELALSEWVSPRRLASLLGLHLDPPSLHKKGLFEVGVLGALKVGIVTGAIAYRKAPADMEQNSEAEDVTAGAFAEANRRNRELYRQRPSSDWADAYHIDPRRAAEWLLSAPMREHWVPETLRSYLRPVEQSVSESAALTRRGPRPTKSERVKSEMRKLPLEKLRVMKQEEMAAEFKAAGSTCREARKAILAEIETPPNLAQ